MKIFVFIILLVSIMIEVILADPRCSVPIEPGPCLAYMPRFGFDSSEGKCKEFIYGGCQGNTNKFSNLAECQRYCPPGQ